MSEDDQRAIEEEYHDIQSRNIRTLTKWKTNEGENATYLHLVKAFYATNEVELVQITLQSAETQIKNKRRENLLNKPVEEMANSILSLIGSLCHRRNSKRHFEN